MISKIHRFHGLGSLRQTYQRGKTVRSGEVSLRYHLNHRRSTYRAAVVVSKKVHKSAVNRNRVRRRVFEIIRLNEPALNEPYDIILSVFSDQVVDWPSDRLRREVEKLLAKADVIKSK